MSSSTGIFLKFYPQAQKSYNLEQLFTDTLFVEHLSMVTSAMKIALWYVFDIIKLCCTLKLNGWVPWVKKNWWKIEEKLTYHLLG